MAGMFGLPARVAGMFAPDPNFQMNNSIFAAGMGMLGGANRSQQIQGGLQGYMAGAEMDQARKKADELKAQEAEYKSAMEGYLGTQNVDAALAGVLKANPAAFGSYLTSQMKPPDLPSSFDEFKLAESNPRYAQHLKNSKAGMTFNIGPTGVDYGEPEKGLSWARNSDGTVQLDERGAPIGVPYQGGSVYREQQAATTASGVKDAAQERTSNIVVQDIDRALEKITANPLLTTGLGGQMLSGVGGTPANNVRTLTDTVKSNVGFAQLQAMRESSPTGGALGQVTERELSFLQSALGSLEQSQGDDQLKDNLKRVKNTVLDIVHGPGNGPPRERLGFSSGGGNIKPNDDGTFEWVP